MSELRRHPFTGQWVVVAPDRARRPSDFHPERRVARGRLCPFCPGHEAHTPPEILALHAGAGGPWRVRVVPNRFPALRVETELGREGVGVFDRMEGTGAHEVIVETPRHDASLADLSPAEIEDVLWVWAERLRDLARDERLRHVQVFKNHGEPAGATLEHAHSQLVALPLVPDDARRQLEREEAHFRQHERCLTCDLLHQEIADGARVIDRNDAGVVLSAWAPRRPFETWVVPRAHQAHFADEPQPALRAYAELLRSALRRLDVALERPAYNLVLRTAPLRTGPLAHSHWRLEVLPAVSRFAGFEWGTGCLINPVGPDEAAAYLRRAASRTEEPAAVSPSGAVP